MSESESYQSTLSSRALEEQLKNYICPLTKQMYEDPVILPCCGNTFSRKALQFVISMDSKCPKFTQIKPNIFACSVIQTYRKQKLRKQRRRKAALELLSTMPNGISSPESDWQNDDNSQRWSWKKKGAVGLGLLTVGVLAYNVLARKSQSKQEII